VIVCNTASVPFQLASSVGKDLDFFVSEKNLFTRQTMSYKGKTCVLGEGMVAYDNFLKAKIFKGLAPGFLYLGHKMPIGIDIKNYWDVFRGYDLPFKNFCPIRHLTLKDRLLLGIEWSSPMEKSLEMINWCVSEVYHPGTLAKNRRYLVFNYFFIKNNLERKGNGHGNNHLLSNLAALAIFESCCLKSTIWRQELLTEAAYQYRTDGTNFEGSTAYHFFSTEILLTAYIFLQKPQELNQLLGRAIGVCSLLLRQDGSIPYIGDNDSGRVTKLWVDVSPSGDNLESFEDFLSSASQICEPISPEPIQFLEDTKSLSSEGCIFAHMPFSSQAFTIGFNADDVSFYRLDGLSLYLIQLGELTVTFKVGPLGQNGVGGHDHYDQLSVTVTKNSSVVFDDLGVRRYFGGSIEERGKSVANHNSFIDSRQLEFETSRGFHYQKCFSEYHICSKNLVAGILHYKDFSVGRQLSVYENKLVITDYFTDEQDYLDPLNKPSAISRFDQYGKSNL
jgi:hypothetical protein